MERQFARKRADFEQNEQSIKIRMSTYMLHRLEGLENSWCLEWHSKIRGENITALKILSTEKNHFLIDFSSISMFLLHV